MALCSALSLLYAAILNGHRELPYPRPPRILDQLRLVLRCVSEILLAAYRGVVRQLGALFHPLSQQTPPSLDGCRRGRTVPDPPAVQGHVSASTQNQARSTPWSSSTATSWRSTWAISTPSALAAANACPSSCRPKKCCASTGFRVPTGCSRPTARLLYGCGLSVVECCSLRVHDLDLQRGQILGARRQGQQGPSCHAAVACGPS